MKFPKTPSFDLTGKRALVTGASSGIGLAGAVALAEHGAEVTLAARDAERLRSVADHMAAENWMANILPMDLANAEEASKPIEGEGPFDILLNSAGTARHSKATDTTFADFDAVMNVNLRGAYFVTQAVARGMISAGRQGSLINISSQMAHVGGVDRAVYCASKAAVEGFTKAMAIEFGPLGIRINTICPTFIVTPLTQAVYDNPQKRAWALDKIKLGRIGEVQDVMGAVLYLASDASSLVTGTSLLVDGGWTAD